MLTFLYFRAILIYAILNINKKNTLIVFSEVYMNIEIYNKNDKLLRCKEIVQEVYEKFLELLQNKALFKAKNSLLTINLMEELYEDLPTSGICSEIDDDASFKYTINLLINIKNSEKYIAFVAAHELAHLYFCNLLDPVKTTGRSKDESTCYTAIKRIFLDCDEFYGETLEEMCADYLARHIVSMLDFEDENNQFENMCQIKKERFDFIESLSAIFGSSLSSSKFIEAYYIADNIFYIQNKFWYYISTFNFNEIIDEYDDFMGESAFYILNMKIEEYFGEKNPEAKDFLYSELNRFKMLFNIKL